MIYFIGQRVFVARFATLRQEVMLHSGLTIPTLKKAQPKHPKHHPYAGMTLEAEAWQILREILPRSVKERTEIGAVIYKDNCTGDLGHIDPIADTGPDDGSIVFPFDQPNTAAIVHTYPFKEGDMDGLVVAWNEPEPAIRLASRW